MPNGLARLVVACALSVILAGCEKAAETPKADVLEHARTAIAERRFSDALEIMRDLVERDPDDSEIQRYYGEALLVTGQPSLAVWPLARAMRDADQAVPAGLLLASAQLQGGSANDAIKSSDRVLELEPDNTAALLLRARAYLQENVEERALADIDRATELGMREEDTDLLRLDALLGLNREEESAALLEKLHEEAIADLEIKPARAAQICAATAIFAFEKGDAEEATRRFEECLDDEGLFNMVLARAAIEFFDEQGDFDRATNVYKRRFEAGEDRLVSRVHFADRLQKRGRSAEAEALLLEATEDQVAAWSALVDFYVIEQDFPKALDALEKSIAANPYAPDGWFLSRADYLIILSRLDEAEKAIQQIKAPSYKALMKGRLNMQRGNYGEAAQFFEEGVRLWPDNPDARYLAGHNYELMGEWARAASHFREAARMDPPHYASSLALADILLAIGDYEGMGFVVLRMAELRPDDTDLLEKAIEYARASGQEQLGRQLFVRYARIPEMADDAVYHAASLAAETDGPAAGLAVVEASELDPTLPENVEVLAARCLYLGRLGRTDEAFAAIEAALAVDPDSTRLIELRARTDLEAGNFAAAISDYQAARSADPASFEAALGLARAERASGDAEAAFETFAEAIDLEASAGSQRAALALAEFQIAQGRRGEAKMTLRSILDRAPRNGEAAWLLVRMLVDEAGGSTSPTPAIADLAQRADLFQAGPEAKQLFASIRKSVENEK